MRFFRGSRLTDYLFSHRSIHSGRDAVGRDTFGPLRATGDRNGYLANDYGAAGDSFSFVFRKRTNRSRPVSRQLITAIERGDVARVRNRAITPEELALALRRCDEIGAIGEQVVLASERRRLTRLGFALQADQVEHVSIRSISEGFDIMSFEDDGTTLRYLEVKSTSGTGSVVNMSLGEWRAAERLGNAYYIARVVNAEQRPSVHYVRNPVELVNQAAVTRTASGWRLDLRDALPAAARIR